MKKIENRLIFGELMGKNLVSSFFNSQYIKTDFLNRYVIRNMQQNLHVLRFREENGVFGKKSKFCFIYFPHLECRLKNKLFKVLIKV